MQRRIIKTAKVRIVDTHVGDIVNRYPDAEKGWFEVATVSTLFNGDLQLADETSYITISGGHNDLIGVQFAQVIEVPDTGPAAQRAAPPSTDQAPADAPTGPDRPAADREGPQTPAGASSPPAGPVPAGLDGQRQASPAGAASILDRRHRAGAGSAHTPRP